LTISNIKIKNGTIGNMSRNIQGGPKVGIEYIIVYSIITVYLLLAHPSCIYT